MRQTDLTYRSFNRSKINALFNGEPPFSDQEAQENNVSNNGNFLEPANYAHRARSTWNNAHLKTRNYCTVEVDAKPRHKCKEWGYAITTRMNAAMKRSLEYVEVTRATGAQVVLHGIGPVWWPRAKLWCPEEIGIEDLLVPSGTKVNLRNLSHFAIWTKYTAGELFRLTHGRKVDPGWNMKVARDVMVRTAKSLLAPQDSYQDLMNPEKITEFYKANGGFLDTDSVPTINVWQFFYQEDEDAQGKWWRKMILDDPTWENADFLYESPKPFAGDLSQVLCVHFGDGANVAPFRYHSVRGFGFLSFFLFHLQNRMRCRGTDAIFEALQQYFRVANAEDRARVQKIELGNLGIVPAGLQFVTPAERWQVNEALWVAGLSQNRQLLQESAASYVQDQDSATGKELTATEVMARLNSANAIVSSTMSMSYIYKQREYAEIARRFSLRNSNDPDVRRFRRECIEDGVPESVLAFERWNVQPEQVMGGGNKTLEITQAKALQEIRPQLEPEAAREADRDYILAVTDDADKAARMVPFEPVRVAPAAHDAQLAFGSIMAGSPVDVVEGIDHVSYVEAFLKSMIYAVTAIQQTGGNATPMQVIGLKECEQHVQGHIEIVEANPSEKERVRGWMDALGQVMNLVKGYAQRLDEAMEAQAKAAQEGNGFAERAKAQAVIAQAQTRDKVATFSAQSDQRRKDAVAARESQRKDTELSAKLRRDAVALRANIEAKDAVTAATVRAKQQIRSMAE